MDPAAYLSEQLTLINTELDQRLPSVSIQPSRLHEAMRYSVMAGGKRIRPLLCLAAAQAAGAQPDQALIPAISLEILHTYTLIHDDLPAMDDDALRRGRPTCHIVFGEALAILAGDALLTLAFEWLAGVSAPAPHHPCQLSLELARAAGCQGVIGGQVEDLAAEGLPPDAELVLRIHERKTAALLRAAVRMGAITAGATQETLNALSVFGERIGLAFQVVDDILNATSSASVLGKAAGSDQARGKLTCVSVFGLKEARSKAEDLLTQALAALPAMPGPTDCLKLLANQIVRRIS